MRHRTTGMGFYPSLHKIYYHTWTYSFKNYGFICIVGVALEKAFSTTVNGLHIQEKLPCYKPQHNNSTIIFKETMDCNTFDSFLHSCNNIQLLKQVHALIFTTGVHQNTVFNTKLIDMYGMLGSMENARRVFDKICERNIYLWNVMIKGYAKNGHFEEAIGFYYQMQGLGTQPDNYTFPAVLKACAGLSALQEGKEIHNNIIATGFESNAFVGTALINMYCKCGDLDIARNVFDKICKSSVVSWNTMISAYVQSTDFDEALKLFNQMQLDGIKPTSITIVSLFSAFAHLGALQQGRRIHAYVFKMGFESDVFVGNSMVAMYAKCGNVEVANQLFGSMPVKDLISWNVMIDGYVQNGNANEARELFKQMQLANVKPDTITIVSMIQACAHLGTLQYAIWIHDYVIQSGFEPDVSVGNSLVAMYAKCGITEDARKVFEKMSKRNVISWTALIAGYVQNNEGCKALKVFHRMFVDGITPDSIAIASLLPLCAELRLVEKGKEIHGYWMRNEFDWDVSVGNALVDMYAKCCCVKDARQMFDKMFHRDVVSWNVMIAVCAQNGNCDEALELFCKIQVAGIEPDPVTISSILPACAHLAALRQGKEIHNYIFRRGFESDIFVGNGLIDMYGKCGSIDDASLVFDRMSERDIVSWTAMIVGCGMHGYTEYALMLFEKMKQAGMKPNKITFTGLLSACSHGGLVDEGLRYFDCMCREYRITPAVEHYACIVDLLGRAGHLDSAYDFIKNMPLEPTASVWGALHSACRLHCNVELGELIAEHLYELEPANVANYVLMSNIYADAGRWDDVAKIRELSKERGLKTRPGCSWVETKGSSMHLFCVEDS